MADRDAAWFANKYFSDQRERFRKARQQIDGASSDKAEMQAQIAVAKAAWRGNLEHPNPNEECNFSEYALRPHSIDPNQQGVKGFRDFLMLIMSGADKKRGWVATEAAHAYAQFLEGMYYSLAPKMGPAEKEEFAKVIELFYEDALENRLASLARLNDKYKERYEQFLAKKLATLQQEGEQHIFLSSGYTGYKVSLNCMQITRDFPKVTEEAFFKDKALPLLVKKENSYKVYYRGKDDKITEYDVTGKDWVPQMASSFSAAGKGSVSEVVNAKEIPESLEKELKEANISFKSGSGHRTMTEIIKEVDASGKPKYFLIEYNTGSELVPGQLKRKSYIVKRQIVDPDDPNKDVTPEVVRKLVTAISERNTVSVNTAGKRAAELKKEIRRYTKEQELRPVKTFPSDSAMEQDVIYANLKGEELICKIKLKNGTVKEHKIPVSDINYESKHSPEDDKLKAELKLLDIDTYSILAFDEHILNILSKQEGFRTRETVMFIDQQKSGNCTVAAQSCVAMSRLGKGFGNLLRESFDEIYQGESFQNFTDESYKIDRDGNKGLRLGVRGISGKDTLLQDIDTRLQTRYEQLEQDYGGSFSQNCNVLGSLHSMYDWAIGQAEKLGVDPGNLKNNVVIGTKGNFEIELLKSKKEDTIFAVVIRDKANDSIVKIRKDLLKNRNFAHIDVTKSGDKEKRCHSIQNADEFKLGCKIVNSCMREGAEFKPNAAIKRKEDKPPSKPPASPKSLGGGKDSPPIPQRLKGKKPKPKVGPAAEEEKRREREKAARDVKKREEEMRKAEERKKQARETAKEEKTVKAVKRPKPLAVVHNPQGITTSVEVLKENIKAKLPDYQVVTKSEEAAATIEVKQGKLVKTKIEFAEKDGDIDFTEAEISGDGKDFKAQYQIHLELFNNANDGGTYTLADDIDENNIAGIRGILLASQKTSKEMTVVYKGREYFNKDKEPSIKKVEDLLQTKNPVDIEELKRSIPGDPGVSGPQKK